MKKRFLILFTIILVVVLQHRGNAQFLDTLHEVFTHKSSIDARLESRYSFVNNSLIQVSGARLGVAFQRKLRIGGGLSWLKTDYKNRFYEMDETGKTVVVDKYLKFGYLCFYIDFVFHKTKRWQLSVPIQTGYGLSWFQKKSDYALMGGDKKYFLMLYEPGITAQFKVFRWFGVGSDVAYRFTLKNNKKIGEQLNSPTYSFKVLIWFDQLYYCMFPESKFSKRFGPAIW